MFTSEGVQLSPTQVKKILKNKFYIFLKFLFTDFSRFFAHMMS
jgi:hypothetical protein